MTRIRFSHMQLTLLLALAAILGGCDGNASFEAGETRTVDPGEVAFIEPVSDKASSYNPIIAVIDSGVDALHPDLEGQLVGGYDFVNSDRDADDQTGHGTAMIGIIAANGQVQGVCVSCKVMPLKVTENLSADSELIARAIEYAVRQRVSLIYVGGGSPGLHPSLKAAVEMAEREGILMIAPAGNQGLSTALFPAALDTVLSVVAVDEEGRPLHSTNLGGRARTFATGSRLVTTTPGGGTRRISGSSVAGAYASGIAGIALAANARLTPGQLRQVLRFGTAEIVHRAESENTEGSIYDTGRVLEAPRVIRRSNPDFKDVWISRLELVPKYQAPNQTGAARIWLVNSGNVDTGDFTISLTMSDQLLREIHIASIGLESYRVIDVPIPPVAQSATASIAATVADLPGESDTTNNQASAQLTYTDREYHDVRVTLGESAQLVLGTTEISLPIVVENLGNQHEPFVTVDVFLDGVKLEERQLEIEPGQSVTFLGHWRIDGPESRRERTLSLAAAISGQDANPEDNEWIHTFVSGLPTDPTVLQYADTDGEDIIIDAPWRTMRRYLPVLLYLADFVNFDQGPVRRNVDEFELVNFDVTEKTEGSVIFTDSRQHGDSDQCAYQHPPAEVTFIDPNGYARNGIGPNEIPTIHWHYIMRVPTVCIGIGSRQGESGTHYLKGRVDWYNTSCLGFEDVFGAECKKYHHTNSRILRVEIDPTPLPRLGLEDRHYDIHYHSIAEQTLWNNDYYKLDAARKAYGGPLAMTVEAGYAIGMLEEPLRDGNWTAFKNKIATTDHNVFYSYYDEDPLLGDEGWDGGYAPPEGPTASTDGAAGELQWYKDNFGQLAGEEITLKSGPNQSNAEDKLGHHFLVYDTRHFGGPWHGGGFDRGAATFEGSVNPNSMDDVLKGMKATQSDGFGYAAHPWSFEWPPEYFEQAIGFPPQYNSATGVIVTNDGRDFVFKGSQVWNEKSDQVGLASGSLDGDEFSNMDPFTGDDTQQEFQDAIAWDMELEQAIQTYFKQVRRGLVYSFQEAPNRYFIRKLYMSAGSDAHGDFNYTDSIGSTKLDEIDNDVFSVEKIALWLAQVDTDVASLHSNAFGRVRTYTLTSERPDLASVDPLDASVDAYRDGNTVLTDGPLSVVAVDSDCRHNTKQKAPLEEQTVTDPDETGGISSWIRWHDAKCIWENSDGQIGGYGTFDGGKTALVPVSGQNLLLQTTWTARPDVWGEALYEMAYTLHLLRSSGAPITGALLGKERNVNHTQALPGTLTINGMDPHALVMEGRLLGPPLRPGVEIDERSIANPVWMVPVEINVAGPNACPIDVGELVVTLKFGISMDATTDPEVYIQPLNSLGNSTDPVIQLEPAPGWEALSVPGRLIEDGKLTVRNRTVIPCPEQNWDATQHRSAFQRKSYVVYATNLRDLHGNSLNDVGRTKTFGLSVFPP